VRTAKEIIFDIKTQKWILSWERIACCRRTLNLKNWGWCYDEEQRFGVAHKKN